MRGTENIAETLGRERGEVVVICDLGWLEKSFWKKWELDLNLSQITEELCYI